MRAAGCVFWAAGKTLKHSRLRFALNDPTFWFGGALVFVAIYH
ncbi:hypothetical protein QWZ13_04665 [Reinekea marina]|nr:hypothetical protein [Reinekea marina]MDN3648198.1 hypothetical protein [Reinekea marina]